jgi:hypothetical protein
VNFTAPDHITEAVEHFIGTDFHNSKITSLENLLSSNIQTLREGRANVLDPASARALCFLLETLLVSPNYTHTELVVAVCAITSGVTQSLARASTAIDALTDEKEASSASDLAKNAEELENLQRNFYSLQKKCSALMQIHENYKEQKETQVFEALEQCSSLKIQVEEAAVVAVNAERSAEEARRLALALTQTEKALEKEIVSHDVEKSRCVCVIVIVRE